MCNCRKCSLDSTGFYWGCPNTVSAHGSRGRKPWRRIHGQMVSRVGEVFGASVPAKVGKLWQSDGKVHVIGLVELYACVVSLLHWKPLVASRRVVMFVDNWPALDVLVKGTSLQLQWRNLHLLLEDPTEDNFMLWVAHVPSSNVADHLSRGSVKELEFLRPFRCVEPTSFGEASFEKQHKLKQTGVLDWDMRSLV